MIINSPKDYITSNLPSYCLSNLDFVIRTVNDNARMRLYLKSNDKFDLLEKIFLDRYLDPSIKREIYVYGANLDRFVFIDEKDLETIGAFTFPYKPVNEPNVVNINYFIINRYNITTNSSLYYIISSILSYYIDRDMKVGNSFNHNLYKIFYNDYDAKLESSSMTYILLINENEYRYNYYARLLCGLYFTAVISTLDKLFDLKYDDMDDVVDFLAYSTANYKNPDKIYEFAEDIYNYTIETGSKPQQFCDIVETVYD